MGRKKLPPMRESSVAVPPLGTARQSVAKSLNTRSALPTITKSQSGVGASKKVKKKKKKKIIDEEDSDAEAEEEEEDEDDDDDDEESPEDEEDESDPEEEEEEEILDEAGDEVKKEFPVLKRPGAMSILEDRDHSGGALISRRTSIGSAGSERSSVHGLSTSHSRADSDVFDEDRGSFIASFNAAVAEGTSMEMKGFPPPLASPSVRNSPLDEAMILLQHQQKLPKNVALRTKARRSFLLRKVVANNRREAMRVTHTPLKFTNSQFDLFTSSTGGGIRSGDPYGRFLTGNKTEKIRIPSASEAAATTRKEKAIKGRGRQTSSQLNGAKRTPETKSGNEANIGPSAGGFSVGKAPKGGIIPRSLPAQKRIRKLAQKQQIRAQLQGKWDRLEDLRIHIIARMRSLKHYYGELQWLKNENKRLQEEYSHTTLEMNIQVSEILNSNDDQNRMLYKVHRDRKRQQVMLNRELEKVDHAHLAKQKTLRDVIVEKEKEYQEAILDVQELDEFQKNLEIDPAALKKRMADENARRNMALADHERRFSALQDIAAAEQVEAERTFSERIMTIINQEKSTLSSRFDEALRLSAINNKRLRREIAIHLEHQDKIQAEIDKILEERAAVAKIKEGTKDVRRQVLKLTKFIKCTPDMDFELRMRADRPMGALRDAMVGAPKIGERLPLGPTPVTASSSG
ncbi:hypothetical protein DFS34DRAFT_626724 [Phlyctochytrium arcticum]|nr:hypothetical protein DFS34DRAFT_626724 [Phlyctochytrium arcticum]